MILRDLTDGLCTLRLNRPDKANALTGAMLDSLDAEIVRAEAEGAKALILTGEGKVFSAGADLDAAKAGLATDPVWERLSSRIAADSPRKCKYSENVSGGSRKSVNRPAPDSVLCRFSAAAAEPDTRSLKAGR